MHHDSQCRSVAAWGSILLFTLLHAVIALWLAGMVAQKVLTRVTDPDKSSAEMPLTSEA